MTDSKNTLTPRENEVLALAWQCFGADPKVDMDKLASLTGGKYIPDIHLHCLQYTPSSTRFAFRGIKRKLKLMTAGVDKNNPTQLKHKGAPRKTATKKRAAKDAGNEDDEEEAGEEKPKPKKRAKKATKGLLVHKMMGLGGGEDVKVKPEPEDAGFGWGAGGDEVEDEV